MANDSATSPLKRIWQGFQKRGGDAVFKKRLPLWQKDHSRRTDKRQRCCLISMKPLKGQRIRHFCRVFEVNRPGQKNWRMGLPNGGKPIDRRIDIHLPFSVFLLSDQLKTGGPRGRERRRQDGGKIKRTENRMAPRRISRASPAAAKTSRNLPK